MPPKKQIVAKKEEIPVETLDILEVEKTDSEGEIEAPPPPSTPKPKPKRPLTEKQKENLAKGREKAHERRMLKDLTEKKKDALIQRQTMIDEKKKLVEEKLIKTAVAVRKKQLLEEARLAKYTKELEDVPDEVVKKIIREKKQPKPVQREIETPPPPNPFAGYYFL